MTNIPPKSSGRPRGSRYAITGESRVFPCKRGGCTRKEVTRICQGVRNWAKVAGVKVTCRAVPGAVEVYITT